MKWKIVNQFTDYDPDTNLTRTVKIYHDNNAEPAKQYRVALKVTWRLPEEFAAATFEEARRTAVRLSWSVKNLAFWQGDKP